MKGERKLDGIGGNERKSTRMIVKWGKRQKQECIVEERRQCNDILEIRETCIIRETEDYIVILMRRGNNTE